MECPPVTQKRPLVNQARVGLGGSGRRADSLGPTLIRSVCGPQFTSGLGAPLDKLSPVKVTTLGGAFYCVSDRTEVGVATSYRQTIRVRSGRSRPAPNFFCALEPRQFGGALFCRG
jgi:hypothetical protein